MRRLFQTGVGILAMGLCGIGPFSIPAARAATLGEIMPTCADIKTATYATGRCVGYIEGVIDGLLERRASNPSLFCLPPEATRLDVFEAVVGFMRENGDQAATPAHIIVEYAMRVRFPCERGAQK